MRVCARGGKEEGDSLRKSARHSGWKSAKHNGKFVVYYSWPVVPEERIISGRNSKCIVS